MLNLCQLTRNILSGRSLFKRSGNCCSTSREHPCNCFPSRIDIRLQMVSMFLWYHTIHSFSGLALLFLTLKSSCAMLLLGIASSWTWIKNPKQRPSLRCRYHRHQEILKTCQRISRLICRRSKDWRKEWRNWPYVYRLAGYKNKQLRICYTQPKSVVW